VESGLLFDICRYVVLVSWALLIFAPRWQWTRRLIFRVWMPSFLALCYIYASYSALPFPQGSGFGSLAQIVELFRAPWVMLAGWIHFYAFDLFIGAWQVRDSERHGISHYWLVPCLVFTLYLGPVGLLMYFILRYVKTGTLTTVEEGVNGS
jgi:hypothetical protein